MLVPGMPGPERGEVVESLRVAHRWRRGNVSCVVQIRIERNEWVLLFIPINQKDNNRHDEAAPRAKHLKLPSVALPGAKILKSLTSRFSLWIYTKKANVICPEERGAKRICNLLSRYVA